MNIVAIIQARLGSSRFPRKVLAPLKGKPVICHVVERARQIDGLSRVAVAVPGADGFDIAEALGCPSLVMMDGGEADDVLGRYARVAGSLDADVIVRLTADCPALSPYAASLVLDTYLGVNVGQARIVTNDTAVSGYPDGWDTEVFSREMLERAHREAHASADREHVTSWMKRQPDVLHLVRFCPHGTWDGPKLSIDIPDDLALLEALDW